MSEQSDNLSTFAGSYIERAYEPPEEAVLPRPLIATRGLQPEDVGVIAALLLLDPGDLSTAKELAAYLRETYGWKMSDDRFLVIAKRLMKAGHVERRSVYNEITKRPEWRYRVYRNPANNPEYVNRGAAEASQVRGENRESPITKGFEQGENRVSRGQGRKPVFPVCAPETGNPGFPSGGVLAGQGRKPEIPVSASHPPHPPVGGGTPPPDPLTGADGDKREGEGDSVITEEQIAAASDFLQELPDPWRAGRSTAKKLAPELAAAIQEQGWDLDEALVKKLTFNPEGIRSYSKVLATRIRDLPRKGTRGVPRQPKVDRVPELPKDRVPSEEGIKAARAAYEAFRRGAGRL